MAEDYQTGLSLTVLLSVSLLSLHCKNWSIWMSRRR